jgi:hypothetical protein
MKECATRPKGICHEASRGETAATKGFGCLCTLYSADAHGGIVIDTLSECGREPPVVFMKRP